jgi:hypothetical protein
MAEVDPQAAAELAGRAGDVVQLAREARSNVSRHAKAATCRVSLYLEGDGDAVAEEQGHPTRGQVAQHEPGHQQVPARPPGPRGRRSAPPGVGRLPGSGAGRGSVLRMTAHHPGG